MKSILMSIKPKYVAKILNGEKTIEIRKRFPLEYRGWVYIYCTKDNHQLVKPKDYDKYLLFTKGALNGTKEKSVSGKVVARFYCDNVEDIVTVNLVSNGRVVCYRGRKNGLTNRELMTFSCLTFEEMHHYLQGKTGYAVHISQLEIFDKPKELNEFKYKKLCGYGFLGTYYATGELTKAPQSMMYIEVEE